ncbi:MAG: hypothetical protein QXU98_11360 [Candidatus Parvarchaeota archaeon]
MGYTPSKLPLILSIQSGLSGSSSTANTSVAVGNTIDIPQNGIMIISMIGHESSNTGSGFYMVELTRGGTAYQLGTVNYNSLFGNDIQYNTQSVNNSTSPIFLSASGNFNQNNTSGNTSAFPFFEFPVLQGDSIQFYVGNSEANNATYIDQVVVMLK